MNTRSQTVAAMVGACALVSVAWGHGAQPPPAGSRWWLLWNPDPVILVNLVLLAALYAAGLHRQHVHRVAFTPRAAQQLLAFVGGLLFLIVALLSPVDVLAGELLWVHMVQHMVLMNLAAPLFVLGAPGRVMMWALPPSSRQWIGPWRRDLARRGIPRYFFWQPTVLWLIYAVVLWIWHLPDLYEAALRHKVVHDLQHLMFFAASCLFWRVLFDPIGRLRMARGPAVLYLFLTSLHATVLGVFMALAPRLWYPTYTDRTEPWGLRPLEDQQLAGYIMWMPACMVYALIAAILFATWLREEPARAPDFAR